jgi:hypothetical protein
MVLDPEVRPKWRERFYASATDPAHFRADVAAVLAYLDGRGDHVIETHEGARHGWAVSDFPTPEEPITVDTSMHLGEKRISASFLRAPRTNPTSGGLP